MSVRNTRDGDDLKWDNSSGNVCKTMAQQVQNLDPTRRLFEELKSKNEDVRTRASNELRETLNSLSRGG